MASAPRPAYRRSELLWIAAAAGVTLLLWRFSDASLGWLERAPLIFFLGVTLVLLAQPWLRRRFGERIDRVGFDREAIWRHGAAGARERLDWASLARIELVARGEDAAAEPSYWLFLDASGRNGCAVPEHAEGLEALIHHVRTLPGYSEPAEAQARAARDQRRVRLWQRSGKAPRLER